MEAGNSPDKPMTLSYSDNPPVIHVVDDDEAVRAALTRLIESMGMRAESFASPEELLGHECAEEVDCLLLDVHLPGMDGFELYERIVRTDGPIPAIFITGQPDEASRAKAKKARAVAFFEKPFDDRALYLAIQLAVHRRDAQSKSPCSS